MGLDAYFPLTNHDDPSVTELVSAWSMNRSGENVLQDVLNFAGAHPTKPVIFSEIGYRSIAGSNYAPWDWTPNACPNPNDNVPPRSYPASCPVDDTEQANAYEAMFEVWSLQTASMKGNFWWAWPVPPPNISTDTDYNPRDKPVQTTLQNWQ